MTRYHRTFYEAHRKWHEKLEQRGRDIAAFRAVRPSCALTVSGNHTKRQTAEQKSAARQRPNSDRRAREKLLFSEGVLISLRGSPIATYDGDTHAHAPILGPIPM